jgi:chromate reductase
MKNIVAFGASNSSRSINKAFASYAAKQVTNARVKILDLNQFEMPIYSIDREEQNGVPALAYNFKTHLKEADGIIISLAEHNGAYTTAFKNILDWISRIEKDVWYNRPMLLLATSPGGRGAKTVLDIAKSKFKFMNNNTIETFSLPLFKQNFDPEEGILDQELNIAFQTSLTNFSNSVDKDIKQRNEQNR